MQHAVPQFQVDISKTTSPQKRGGMGKQKFINSIVQILTFCWPCLSVYLSQ